MRIARGALIEKIVIIGSAGAGKSTLARKLDPILNMKAFHLDRLLWEYDWKGKAEFERMELLEKFAFGGKRWIIEGNYLRSSKIHLDTADTIIFLDISPLVCCWHLIRRSCEYYNCPRYDIPSRCTDKITLRRLWKTLTFPFHGRKMIEQTLSHYESKHIITLRSTKEVEAFLVEQGQNVVDKKNSGKAFSISSERILAPRQYPELTPLLARKSVIIPTIVKFVLCIIDLQRASMIPVSNLKKRLASRFFNLNGGCTSILLKCWQSLHPSFKNNAP